MNISTMIECQAARMPDKAAVLLVDGRLTYDELNRAANRVAGALSALGIAKGDRVAIWLPNGAEFLASFFGILKIGAIALPMNILFKEREIRYILSDSGSQAVIAMEEGLGTLRAVRPSLPALEEVLLVGKQSGFVEARSYCGMTAKASDRFFAADLHPDDTAAILYTSGTTGNPKGAMLTHANLFLNSEYYAAGLGAREDWVGLCVLPLSHLLSLAAGVLVLFGRGGTMHVMKQFVADEAAQLISRHKINYTFAVPTVYARLLALPKEPRFDLTSLDVCIVTGSVTPDELRKAIEKEIGCRTIQAYGQVESSPVISVDRVDRKRKFGSVGYPLPHVEVKIVDDDDRTLSPNNHGEICAKGHCVMAGYWNNPEGTRAAIRDGWLHTGDIGMLDVEGYLYIFDRKKDMIICGGYNIYPVELEDVLYENPKVLEAAVVGVPDKAMGEIPKAFIVLKPGEKADGEEIMDFVQDRLAKYKKLRMVEFLDVLPKGPTGKILRRSLREAVVQK
ncbi:MAG: class I adenylate-forming enzyme family protein [Desulfobacteria bacterium]|nr:long-chain-fatty-acid--CoA ligase [Deltaproteobacteria bacterium]